MLDVFLGKEDTYLANVTKNHIESEYFDTVKNVVVWDVDVQPDIAPEVGKNYVDLTKKIMSGQEEYFDTYLEIEKEYKKEGYWKLLTNSYAPDIPSKTFHLRFDVLDHTTIGFANLRFLGSPTAVKTVSVVIGGKCFDKIYPCITGALNSITLFDTLFPNIQNDEIEIVIEMCEKQHQIEISYDRFLIKNISSISSFELPFTTTQFISYNNIKMGKGLLNLYFKNPTQKIQVFSTAALTNPNITLTKATKTVVNTIKEQNYSMLVYYKGQHYGYYWYEVQFHGTVNLSQCSQILFTFESLKNTEIHLFAKSLNIVHMNSGIASLVFPTKNVVCEI